MYRTKKSRVLAFFLLFNLLMQAVGAAEELPQVDMENGTVVVFHQSTDGTMLGGGIVVVDATGAAHEQYDGGSGVVFEGLPPGEATVRVNGAAEGHYPADPEHIVVVSASQATVTLVSEPIPVPPTEVPPPPTEVPPTEVPTDVPTEIPTEVPTEEPTEVPTEEPTVEVTEEATAEETEEATEAATEEPTAASTPTSTSRMSTQNDVVIQQTPGSPSVVCNPTIDGESFVALYIPVTDGPLAEAPSVRYKTTDRFGNEAGPVTFGDMTWDAANERYAAEIDPYTFAEIDWEYDLHLGAGWQQVNGGGCAYFPPLDLGIGTLAQDAEGNPLEDGAQVPSGTPFRDTAIFEGPGAEFAPELAGETVTYRLYLNDGTCSGSPVFEEDVVVNADGTIPPSSLFDPTALGDGIYDWRVSYAGDGKNFNPALSVCGWETVVVGQNDTSIATTMMNADTGGVIGHNTSVPLGTTVYDTTQLSAISADAGGTVTYTLFQGACGSEQTVVDGPHEVSVTNGVVEASPDFTPTEQGVYNWVVEYSGDEKNTGATSACGQETFAVAQAAPSITTAMFQADGTPIGQGSSVPRGTEVYDTTTITGFYAPEGSQVGGTITYTLYRGENCDGGEVGSVTLDVAGVVDGGLPASNAEGALFTADAVGTYNWVVTYSGDDFNAEATSGCGEETFVVEQNQTTISTQPQLATGEDAFDDIALDAVVSAPADVRDTAELAGNTADAGGSVTYYLYEGACGNLTEVEVFGPYDVVDGVVPPSDVTSESLEPGQYNWIAVYTGDGDNIGSESPCGEEQFFVAGEGVGGYVHTQVFTDAGAEVPNRASVPLGTAVIDTAQFYGDIVNEDGTAAVGGSITYTLYQGEGCGTDIETWTYPVTSGEAVPAVPADEAYRLIEAGEYNFQAVFTPSDGEPIASPCGTETLFVEPVDLSLTTHILDMDADSVEIEHGTRVVRPINVADDVTFDYGFDDAYMEGLPLPNGTLTYTLYNDANCGGDVVSESTSTVINGEFTQSDTVALGEDDFGTYNWFVTFQSDDENYTDATSPCGSETFYLDAEPSMTTTMNMSVDGNEDVLEDGGSVTVGDLVRDSASLSNYAPGASGTVTFTLHQGLDCTGTVMFEQTLPVNDPESVGPTDWYEIQLFGNYSWQAAYSGDNTSGGYNAPVTHCENETFIAAQADAEPTMETVMFRGGDTVIPHQSYIFGPATVSDQAIFTNLSTEISGTITYTLYTGQGTTCANLTEVESWTVNVTNGIAERSGEYAIEDAPFGGEIYSWGVVFTSDDGNTIVTSECDREQFRIYGPNTIHGINVACTYHANDNTMSFELEANPRPVAPDAGDVDLTINLTAYNRDLSPADPIPPYQNEWEISFDHEAWRRVEGTATWSNGESATFVVRCNQNPMSPELETTMYQQTDAGDVEIENGAELDSGAVVYDTTQVVPGTSTVVMSGTLTYELYYGADCATLISEQVITLDDDTPIGELPASDPVTVSNPGLYNWIVTYSPPAGDEYPDNEEAVSPCCSEFFNVNPVDTSLTTLIVTESNSATEAELGEDVYDTAQLTIEAENITLTPTGTVTYYVYEGRGADVCVEANLYDTFGPYDLNADGTLPDSDITWFLETGEYEYQAVYSGDENFNSSTSECGSEPLTISEPVLEIEKVAHTETINTGEQIGFTIKVTNPGTGIATGVTITDELPATDVITWGVPAGSHDTCALDEETGVVECGPVDLDGGETLELQITGATSAEACGEVENIASFGSDNANEGEDGAIVTILCPDVVVEKTAGTGEVSAGDTISFTMTLTNLGPGVAYGAALTDTLPTNAGLGWTIAESDATCSIDGGVLSCEFGTLEAEQSASVTITSVTTAETCGVVENDVAVSARNEPEANNDEDNEDNASITVNCPDVEIEKTTSTASVNATDQVSFDIRFGNIGDGTAYDVTVEDALPAGLTWTLVGEVEGCGLVTNEDTGAQTFECFFEEMAPDAEFTVSLTAETSFETCGIYENIASISAENEPEGNSENNESEATVEVLCSEVELTKTADDETVSAGDQIGFTISMVNTGEGVAYGAVLTDSLPVADGLTWTMDPANEACTIHEETGLLTCEVGDLAPEASFSVHVVSMTTAETCGLVENDATVSFTNAPDENDEASVEVLCPDVSILKTAVEGTINATDTASFELVVTNAGPGTAYDVEVADELPSTLTGWALDPEYEGCEVVDGVLTCEFAEMAPEATHTITVSAPTTLEQCGPHENAASVSAGNESEENEGNNESTATISVNCSDVELTKIADEDVVSAGDQIGFTIAMVNTGDGIAYDAVLTDILPTNDGLEWTIDPANDACAIDEETGELTCEVGDLAQGDEFSVRITSMTTADTCGIVDNSAEVNFRDGNTEPAYASDQVEVQCPTPTIEKVADETRVNAGDEIAFTITASNGGPGNAYDVILSDTLPNAAGTEWIIAGGEGAEFCEITEEGVLECDFGTMEPESSWDIRLISPTTYETCSDVTNTASLDLSNGSPVESTDEITVLCPDPVIEKVADQGTVSAGDDIGFTITITNDGEGTAYGVSLADTLPTAPGTDWVIDGGDGAEACVIEDGVLLCDFGPLEQGESLGVHISSTTTAETCGIVDNTATVSFTNAPSEEDAASVEVLCPDIEVVKTADNEAISATQSIDFTITVTNIGEGNAYDVAFTDTLPAGFDWAMNPDVEGCAIDEETGVLTCDFGTMEPEAVHTIQITAPTTVEQCGIVENVASASAGNEPESALENNESAANVTINCGDVVLEKTTGTEIVSAGEQIDFTITVTNTGEGDAFDTLVTDTLPANDGLAWTIDPANENCVIEDGVLTCDFGTVAAGASASVTIVSPTTLDTCGEVANAASASFSNHDDREAEATVTVLCSDTALTKVADAESVMAGEDIGFTITLINNSEGDAFDAVLTDVLPDAPGLAWSIDDGNGADACTIEDGVLTCDFGTVGAGTSLSVHISSPTTAESCGVIDNAASVSFSNADPLEDSDSVTVNCPDPEPSPEATGTPAPGTAITGLPSTGNGGGNQMAGTAVLLLAVLALIAAATAAAIRREQVS